MTPIDDETLVDMHTRERMTLGEIAAEVGLSRERVRQRVRRAGIGVDTTAEVSAEYREAARPTSKCEQCGAVFHPDRDHRRFCSPKCFYDSRVRYTDEDLLDHLRHLAKRLGRTPTLPDIIRMEGPAHTAYYRRFGDYRKACALAGLEPNHRGGSRR